MTSSDPKTCQLREAVFEDHIEATELLRDLGLIMPEGERAIQDHWHRLWIDNPAMRENEHMPSLGWVLEEEGRMVGFFGNIPLLYFYGDQRVIVSDASQWGVMKDYRGQTSELADAYFNQKNVDLEIVTTAIKPTGRLFERYGAKPIPQSEYDKVLFWPLNGTGFFKAMLRKKGVSPSLVATTGAIGGMLVAALVGLTGRRPKGAASSVDAIGVDDIDSSFDHLWQEKKDELTRLLACRSSDSLKWHFGLNSLKARTRVLTFRRDGLRGYAVLLQEDSPNIGLKRLKIVDLLIAGDDKEIFDALLAKAYAVAREGDCHVLELVGLPGNLRKMAQAHRPFVRRLPTWPLFYKPCNDTLTAGLQEEGMWYVTPYDGDTSLF